MISIVCFIGLIFLVGCASTEVITHNESKGEKLARPERIIVHDFAATPSDIPYWSAAANRYANSKGSQTKEEIEIGRKLGLKVASDLVEKIRNMGLPAMRATNGPMAQAGDIVIMGFFESMDTGSAVKRVALGFGSGKAELKTTVEGYLMTNRGLKRLGSAELNSGGGKTPGTVVPLAVTIATANPIGLIIVGGVKVTDELSGKSTIEGSAKRTVEKIAEELRVRFKEQGWI